MDDDKKYWVTLSTHKKIGARTFNKLFLNFKKMANVWQASLEDLFSAGLEKAQAEAVIEVIKNKDPDKEYLKVIRRGIDVLTLADKAYPRLLREIPNPPGILYIKGKILPCDELSLAVVGSRKYTNYGQKVIDDLIYPLVSSKLTIVSGLALGIDALAHKKTLECGGRTIAVLGSGLDQIYPQTNVKIADQILQNHGAIISEFPLGTPALRYNFPIRNRIIAGMSLGTIVIEGAPESGSLITAQAAIEFNREIFAVPGSIYSEQSCGPNRLIRMGAKAVLAADDILAELNIETKVKENIVQENVPDTKEEEILLKLLERPMILDQLVRESKLLPQIVNKTVIMMEMKGKITDLGGTRYQIRGKLKK